MDKNVNLGNPNENGIKRDEKGRIIPGSKPLNPAGRPEGSISIIAKIKKKFEEDPERFDEYVEKVLEDERLRAQIINHLDGAPRERKEIDVKLPQFIVDLIKDGTSDTTADEEVR